VFDGITYSEKRDGKRLSSQLEAVWEIMSDGVWRAIDEIVETLRIKGINTTPQSISARLRDLRKKQHGGYTVERKYISNGLWTYRVTA
jgi:hypothetical protein